MRDITFTIYRNKFDTEGMTVTQTWDEWVADLLVHDRRADKDGHLFIAGEVRGARSAKNVLYCDAITVDLEHKTRPELDRVFDSLQPFEYVVYTTHSSCPTDWRCRIVLPFKRPVPAKDWAAVWAALNTHIGEHNDPQTKDASRMNYLPSAPEDGFPPAATRNEGVALDARQLTAKPPEARGGSPIDGWQSTVEDIRRKLRGVNDSDLKPLTDALRKGAPYAERGHRHSATLKLTMWLAMRDREIPEPALEELFAESVKAMGFDMQDVLNGYNGAVGRIETMPDQGDALDEYSETELIVIAQAQGGVTPAQLAQMWIVYRSPAYYFLRANGSYTPPIPVNDARTVATEFLARAPFSMYRLGAKSTPVRRTMQELAEEHGQALFHIEADLTAKQTTYNPRTRTLVEAPCPLRDLKPLEDPAIAEWLMHLGGEESEKLLDWLACLPDLDKPLCALYMSGEPGTGKTLLAHSAARLWSARGVTGLNEIMGNFNAALTRCPLVLADEAVPAQWQGASSTARIRNLISSPSREMNRKYAPTCDLRGFLRMVLTANNDDLLRNEVATAADFQAIAERFLLIEVGPQARDYLATVTGETISSWLEDDLLARHVLWLRDTRTVTRGRRFWVDGNAEKVARGLMTGTRWTSLVCEWLVRYLLRPMPIDTNKENLILREDGKLLVNDRAITDGWLIYHPHSKLEPETHKISTALRTISRNGLKQLRKEGKRIRYREIDIGHLTAWADRANFTDAQTIREALGEKE